ncbi:MAG: chemotaxis protein CheW [Candidatus Marinimicrobia bacterium]|nr:chemotaxis protein CheW [Candidatus Neomarinimicrobiota bacterium]
MLLLLFKTSEGRYALDTQHIIEIVPLLKTKKIPAAPGYVSGMINYHGVPVPVFDLSALEGGESCRPFYSTRIILIRYPLDNEQNTVGIIAEGVTDVIKCSEEDIGSTGILLGNSSGMQNGEAGQEEIVQLFDVARMIPEDIVRELQ